jgi:hypothetical protein
VAVAIVDGCRLSLEIANSGNPKDLDLRTDEAFLDILSHILFGSLLMSSHLSVSLKLNFSDTCLVLSAFIDSSLRHMPREEKRGDVNLSTASSGTVAPQDD